MNSFSAPKFVERQSIPFTFNGFEYLAHDDKSQLLVARLLSLGGICCSCLAPLTSQSNTGLQRRAVFAASR